MPRTRRNREREREREKEEACYVLATVKRVACGA